MKAAIPHHRNRLLLLCVAPFPVAIISTFAFILTVGNRFPRQMAPGQSLALPGFLCAIMMMLAISSTIFRQWEDGRVRRLALVLLTLTSLMAWPVWTTGIMPSINGMLLGPEKTTTMRLMGVSWNHASKSRSIYYWAQLEPVTPRSSIAAGRHFIPQATYENWQSRVGEDVKATHATGLLGREIMLGYR